jgi:hypothetical protein
LRRVLLAPRRNRLGAVTAGVVALGAAAAIVPATAPAGLLLCLAAIVPAIVAVRRSRNGRATNGRLSLASLVMAPVFFLVAFVVVGVTAPPAPARPVTDVAALPVATVPATTAVASTLPRPTTAPAAEPAPVADHSVTVTLAAEPPTVAVRSPSATASDPSSVAGGEPGLPAACGGDTHYRNVDGACVPRPAAAVSAPQGATARCHDGTYSFSLNHRGTCSEHGGVAEFL